MPDYIPFNRIFKDEDEKKAISEVLSGDNWHGDGPVGRRVEAYFCEWLNSRHAFLTTSCTHALEMAMMILEIGEGDEVIMPGFTFVSTANAVSMRGGKPIFADIRDDDLTIDTEDIARKITPATRAVIPVHYAGVSADFDEIRRVIDNRAVSIIEDAAQAVGAFWNGQALGTVGDIGCFSFHDTKNITCGEGGALLTQNDDFAEKAEWIREKGTNRTAFLRGEVDKYTWVSLGSSYVPSELLSAVLEVQLRKKDIILEKRKAMWNVYFESLRDIEQNGWITLPVTPPYAQTNYHIFHFIVRDQSDRDPLISAFRNAGIGASFHYIPLHNAPYARKFLDKPIILPKTEYLADSLIRLPLHPGLADRKEEIATRVHDVLTGYYKETG